MLYAIAFATFLATILGGAFALRFTDKLHLILGFSAGAVLGVAFFDLLPESIELAGSYFSIPSISIAVGVGFVFFMLLDRYISIESNCDGECGNNNHRGRLAAGTFSIHSFLDGLAIGLAFQVSSIVGIIVTVAVLAHDFSDGINTVNLVLKGGVEKKEARLWLLLDAIAPVVGIFIAGFFTLPEHLLGIILSVFCGFFLYIGASELLPESHHRHPTYWTTFTTVLGMAVIFVVIQLAQI